MNIYFQMKYLETELSTVNVKKKKKIDRGCQN